MVSPYSNSLTYSSHIAQRVPLRWQICLFIAPNLKRKLRGDHVFSAAASKLCNELPLHQTGRLSTSHQPDFSFLACLYLRDPLQCVVQQKDTEHGIKWIPLWTIIMSITSMTFKKWQWRALGMCGSADPTLDFVPCWKSFLTAMLFMKASLNLNWTNVIMPPAPFTDPSTSFAWFFTCLRVHYSPTPKTWVRCEPDDRGFHRYG